jgi:tellurite resistance protein TerC
VRTPFLWIGFTLFVLAMLALDLGVFHRRAHAIEIREALLWTLPFVAPNQKALEQILAQLKKN